MTDQLPTEQFLQFLDRKLVLPALPVFNRLEARPRTRDFDRALKAEIRDALCMLTKQWQMGEFKGDDAGSPVSSKVYMEKTMLTKYRPAHHDAEAFDDSVPLETKVEQRKIPFQAGELDEAGRVIPEFPGCILKLFQGLLIFPTRRGKLIRPESNQIRYRSFSQGFGI